VITKVKNRINTILSHLIENTFQKLMSLGLTMRRRNLEIKCSECGKLIFNYVKYGDGNLVKCHKDRIIEDHSEKDGKKVKCSCGNVIGRDRPHMIKMKGHAVDLE